MPAQTKADLLAATHAEYAKLVKTLAKVDAADALLKDAEDTSIKDVVGHRAHWIELFLGWYADGVAGQDVAFPAPGYKWNQLKAYNAALRDAQANLGWQDALTLLAAKHAALVAFLESLSDAQLYGGPMPGADNAWTTGRWAEASGPSHYRSAAKYVRARLKAMG